MRLGLSSAGFYGRMETEEAAASLRGYPIETCEVFLQSFSEYTEDFGRLVRSGMGALPCASVHPKGTQFESDLFSRSPRQTEDAFRWFRGVCEAGEAIGARYYVMHGFWGIRTQRTPVQVNALAERMARCQSIAAAHGMEVLWENVSWCTLRTPEHVLEVRELLPEQGFVMDVKQAMEAGAAPADMVRAMGPALRHVHVLDKGPRGYALPGMGTMDWQAFFAALREIDYGGAVILEPYEPQTRDDAALRRSLEFLQRFMAD